MNVGIDVKKPTPKQPTMKLKLPLNRISENPAIRTTAIAAVGAAVSFYTAAFLSSAPATAVKRGISGCSGYEPNTVSADKSRINLQIY